MKKLKLIWNIFDSTINTMVEKWPLGRIRLYAIVYFLGLTLTVTSSAAIVMSSIYVLPKIFFTIAGLATSLVYAVSFRHTAKRFF